MRAAVNQSTEAYHPFHEFPVPFGCKDKCERLYKDIFAYSSPHTITVLKNGGKVCRRCEIAIIKTKDIHCKCCGSKLAMSPRHGWTGTGKRVKRY